MQTTTSTPTFRIIDADGLAVDVAPTPGADFHVCFGGVQIGDAVDSPAAAQALLDEHLADGVPLADLSVEAYALTAHDIRVGAVPFFHAGRWHAAYESNALVAAALETAAGLDGEVVVFIDPHHGVYDGSSLRAAFCDASAIVSGGRGVVSLGGVDQIELDVDEDGEPSYHNDAYLILPRTPLEGDALDEALIRIRDGLALIASQNDGRVNHRYDRYDNLDMPVADVVVDRSAITTSEETFDPATLLHVFVFEMCKTDDLHETTVEAWFSDGRGLRLRGGFDWENACS